MTNQEEINKLKLELKDLIETLEDLDLLKNYYSNLDPEWKKELEKMILIKQRAIKLKNLL